jgi:ATP-dependent Lhr-like helicase
MISKTTGMNVALQQDPYRIVLKVKASPELVRDLMYRLKPPLHDLFIEAVSKTGIFKRRLIHVARKFGAISKDADVSALSLDKLTDALMETPIYSETIKTILQVDADLNTLEKLLEEVAAGRIEVVSLGQLAEPSPLARIGLEETARRVELMPAERLKALIRESTKTRLLNERVMLICVNCWRVFGNTRVKDTLNAFTCQGCGSKMFGATGEEESRVEHLCSRLRAGLEPSKDMNRLRRQLLASSRLLSKNIFTGLVALVGSHMNVSRAETIVKAEPEYGDRLIERVVEEDRKALARRFTLGKPLQ